MVGFTVMTSKLSAALALRLHRSVTVHVVRECKQYINWLVVQLESEEFNNSG